MKFCPNCAEKIINTNIDGEARLACRNSDCHFVFWDNPVPVVTALVEFENKFIIARNFHWSDDMFSVIAGYLEKGETPEQAVIREVREELGLTACIKNYISCYSYFEKNQLILAYHVIATGTIQLNHELVAFKLLTQSEFKEYDFKSLVLTEKLKQDFFKLIG